MADTVAWSLVWDDGAVPPECDSDMASSTLSSDKPVPRLLWLLVC